MGLQAEEAGVHLGESAQEALEGLGSSHGQEVKADHKADQSLMGGCPAIWLWVLIRDCTLPWLPARKWGLEGYWDPKGQGCHVTVLLRLDLHRVRPVRPWNLLLLVRSSPVCRLLPIGFVFGLECNGVVVTWGRHRPAITGVTTAGTSPSPQRSSSHAVQFYVGG